MSLKTLYYGLLALCLVTLLIRYRRLPAYCLWFIPIIAIGFITELLKGYFANVSNTIQRIYQPIECLLLLLFYNHLLIRPRNKNILVVGYILYLVISFCYYLYYRKSFNIQDYFDFIAEALLIVILVTLFFFELLDYKEEMNLLTYGAFWINAVNLIFYCGCFFAMAAYEQISKNDSSLSKQLKTIPHYLNLFLYSAYIIIFSTAKK